MDATQEQATVDALKTKIDADNATLATDSADLQDAEDALANVMLINALESLTADQVSAINVALASDADNKSGITLALPPATT